MSKSISKITLKEHSIGFYNGSAYTYSVQRLINRQSPCVGEALTDEQVRKLIDNPAVDVTISSASQESETLEPDHRGGLMFVKAKKRERFP